MLDSCYYMLESAPSKLNKADRSTLQETITCLFNAILDRDNTISYLRGRLEERILFKGFLEDNQRGLAEGCEGVGGQDRGSEPRGLVVSGEKATVPIGYGEGFEEWCAFQGESCDVYQTGQWQEG